MGHLIIPPSYSSFHCPFLFPFFVTLIMNQNNFLLIGLFTSCLLESRGTLPISVAPWTVPGTRQSFSKFFPSPLCPQCARHSLSLRNGDESGVGSMRANSMPILDFWDLKANKTWCPPSRKHTTSERQAGLEREKQRGKMGAGRALRRALRTAR